MRKRKLSKRPTGPDTRVGRQQNGSCLTFDLLADILKYQRLVTGGIEAAKRQISR